MRHWLPGSIVQENDRTRKQVFCCSVPVLCLVDSRQILQGPAQIDMVGAEGFLARLKPEARVPLGLGELAGFEINGAEADERFAAVQLRWARFGPQCQGLQIRSLGIAESAQFEIDGPDAKERQCGMR